MHRIAGVLLLLLFAAVSLRAQGESPGAHFGTAAGQAEIRAAARNSAPTPRLPDGTPNLGRVGAEKGIWELPGVLNFAQVATGSPENPDPRLTGPGTGGAAKESWVPFRPWAAALYNYNAMNDSKYDPEGYCLPPGGPRMMGTPYPAEILQLPEQKRIVIIYEGGAHIWREIYMDGRPHPPKNSFKGQSWLGHSVGHWEGDTLVVDTVGFNEGTWLDRAGHPHTDLLHVVERFTRPNKNTLHFEATVDDPGAYTRPWSFGWDIPWRPDDELQEYICQENNRYMRRLNDDFGNPIFYEPKK